MPAAPIVTIDPQHPQPRLIERAVQILSSAGLIAFPTDTYYGIGCDLFDKRAIERIYQLKQLPKTHELSFICADMAEVSRYAIVDNAAYRVLRRKAPGPFTFILPATRLVPDLVLRRQKTVGIRVPDSPIALALVQQLAHPVISTSAATPGGEVLIDARDIKEQLGHGLELILDGGYRPNEPSSVIDLTGPEPTVGAGPAPGPRAASTTTRRNSGRGRNVRYRLTHPGCRRRSIPPWISSSSTSAWRRGSHPTAWTVTRATCGATSTIWPGRVWPTGRPSGASTSWRTSTTCFAMASRLGARRERSPRSGRSTGCCSPRR